MGYDAQLGRFLSADTIVASLANPQSLNRYSYVSNNPINNTDPTGHKEMNCQYGEVDGHCASAPSTPPSSGSNGSSSPAAGATSADDTSGDGDKGSGSDPAAAVPANRGNGEWAYNLFLQNPAYFAGLRMDPGIWDKVGSCDDSACVAALDFKRYVGDQLHQFPDQVLFAGVGTAYGDDVAQALKTQISRNQWASAGMSGDDLNKDFPLVPAAAAVLAKLREGVSVQLGFTSSELGTLGAPGPGFVWKGAGTEGTGNGAWYNPDIDVQLRPDLAHPNPIGSHWDYLDSNGIPWRIWEDGSMSNK